MKRIAVVSGATGDIGKCIAKSLAIDGWHIAALSRSQAKVDAFIQELAANQVQHHIGVQYNPMDQNSCREAIETIETTFDSSISTCVNASGVVKDSLLLRLKENDLHEMINGNLIGAIQLNKAVTRSLLKCHSDNKSIINIGSVIGSYGNIGQVAYSASKAGLHGMTKTLAKELGNRAIRVNLVEPGFIQSKMTQNVTMPSIALGRLGTPQNVADLVTFLVSSKAEYITGQILRVDGGITL